jgi:hypothetical protein
LARNQKRSSSGTLKFERFENQIILNVLEESKPKGLNRIAKIDYGHLYMREENINLNIG